MVGSQNKKENIVLKDIKHSHHNHLSSEGESKAYNEQRRESLPGSSLIHHASTSVVTPRLDRGAIDLQGVPRVVSDDSPVSAHKTVVNVAATVAVKTDSKCCNSNCCDDDHDNRVWCCC